MITFFSVYFHINSHLYLISFMPSNIWTHPNISHVDNEFIYVWMTFFHFGQWYLHWHSSLFCCSRFSLLLMTLIATFKEKTLSIIIVTSILYCPHYMHNSMSSLYFQVLMSFYWQTFIFLLLLWLFVFLSSSRWPSQLKTN